ncbi:MFS transporter [Candidatus Sumerlaeota bacterium]|nr:MFS transporter [Candidatus Sumerlaeota bacterium]
MFSWLKPYETIDREDLRKGLHILVYEGICTHMMSVFTGGAFLVAFALLLGASNRTIGLIAAIGPLSQIMQIPAIYLVEKVGQRKLVGTVSLFFARVLWIPIILLPWCFPDRLKIPVFLVSYLIYFSLIAIYGCSFNSWMRDLIPDEIRGRFFSKRLAIAIAIGSAIGLGAAVGVDLYAKHFENAIPVYSLLFTAGIAFGFTGVYFLARTPEPRMQPADGQGVLNVLRRPFADANFRRLLLFLAWWNFAVNLAAPFFTVYMLRRIGLSMTFVLALVVLSQVANVVFLRIWGGLSDRLSNKSVLAVSGPQFLICILIWPFTTLPERYALTIPLLVAIHVLAGISTAGVILCSSNIAVKLAPRGAATSYLAVNALVSGLAACVAPVLAGSLADVFSHHELSVSLKWVASYAETKEYVLPALDLRALDFLFILAFLVGLLALRQLVRVREIGEVHEDVAAREFFAEVRKAARHVSSVAGLRRLTYFPYHFLLHRRRSNRVRPSEEGPSGSGPNP